MRIAPWLFLAVLGTCAAAQVAASANPAADAKRQSELQAILDQSEPGAQQVALDAFLRQYPNAPEAPDIYSQLIADATALNDDRAVLTYNERLQEFDPGDIGQRIKTLNLILLEADPQDRALAARYADDLQRAVEAKAHEAPPAGFGVVRWQVDLNRMRAAAAMFQGAAAQESRNWPLAEKDFTYSLSLENSENSAEHLAQVYVAQEKWPEALNSYALALSLPGPSIADRAALRSTADAIYRRLHNNTEAGFGDLILQQFDAVAARDAAETASLDPGAAANAGAKSALDFALTDLAGKSHKLAELRGKVVVLSFLAAVCDDCREQQREAAAAQTKDNNRDVIYIVVGLDDDATSAAAPRGTDTAVSPAGESQWRDAGLADYLSLQSAPATLVLDRRGNIVYRREGLDSSSLTAELLAALARARGAN